MTDFQSDAADAAERAIARQNQVYIALGGLELGLIVFTLLYLSAHLGVWASKGYRVVDSYHHSSKESPWLVSPEEVKIEELYR